MLLEEALDRVVNIYRLPETQTGTALFGDMDDTYALLLASVPARYEVTKVDTWTVWIMDDTETPRHGDRFLTDDLELEVDRVQPWTQANGDFHHFEMTAKEVFGTRTFADAE